MYWVGLPGGKGIVFDDRQERSVAAAGPVRITTPMLKTQGVNAVDRALVILDSFLSNGSWGLGEIAKATGLAKPTVMRSLVSLERAGYVVRLSDGRYQLGAKAMQLGMMYRASFRLDQHVLPLLRRLSQETLESSAFHIREKDSRLCLFRVESPQSVREVPPPIALVPLDATSTGQVLAASSWPTKERLATPLVYASSGVFNVLTASISTAVFGMDRALVGALTVSGPVQRFGRADIKAMARSLARAAHELSLVLGAPLPKDIAEPRIVRLKPPA